MPIVSYYSSDKREEDLMDGGDMYGGEQKCMLGFVGNPEGKRPLGRPKRRRENGIKIYLTETGW
jgi:hypothetical protein